LNAKKMKTIALYSIKGGVGKTAAAVNLSYLASKGDARQTLICDLDPQGASSFYFRISPRDKYNSTKFLEGSAKIYKNIKATDFEGLDLLPSDFSYRNLDLELLEEKKPQKKLRKNINELSSEYRYIFFDCPPNLTLFSESIFAAADIILVPVIPTTLSIRTYEQLRKFFNDTGLDSSKIRGFFNMVEKRKSMHREIIEQRGSHPDFLKSSVPYNSEVEKMGIYRAPLNAVHPSSAAAKAFRQLWEEIQVDLLP